MEKRTVGGASDDTCGYIVGSGKGRLGPLTYLTTVWRPATACQTTCLEENALQRTPLPASRDGLRGTAIGQTHNDISGTIIGQMRLDRFAPQ